MSKRGYRGALSPAQAAEGSAAALENSKRLLADAEMLFSAGRKPTAIALAVLAAEEATKTQFLWLVAAAKTDDARRAAWEELSNHKFKQDPLLHITRSRAETGELGGPLPVTAFEDIKQRAFYVDAGEDQQGFYWSEPDGGRFDGALGTDIMTAVRRIIGRAHATSRREVELWAEHFSFDEGEDAGARLSLWEAAMTREGLYPRS